MSLLAHGVGYAQFFCIWLTWIPPQEVRIKNKVFNWWWVWPCCHNNRSFILFDSRCDTDSTNGKTYKFIIVWFCYEEMILEVCFTMCSLFMPMTITKTEQQSSANSKRPAQAPHTRHVNMGEWDVLCWGYLVPVLSAQQVGYVKNM